MEKTEILRILIPAVGVLVAILGYRFATRRKRLTFTYRNKTLHSEPGDEAITISYRGQPVQKVAALRVVVWNVGRPVIRFSEDIPRTEPPHITFRDGARILSVSVVGVSKAANDIAINQVDSRRVDLSFEYLNHGDGIALRFVYENGTSEVLPVAFCGEILDGAAPRALHYMGSLDVKEVRVMAGIVLTLGGAATALLVLVLQSFIRETEWRAALLGTVLGMPAGVLFCVGWLLLHSRRALPRFARPFMKN